MFPVQLAFNSTDRLSYWTDFARLLPLRAVLTGSKALSAGPPGPAEILPGTAINVALGIQSFRTRVFRGVELKDHPLRIRNARIGRRVQKPDVFVREPKVYRTDVIFQLLEPSGQRRSHC